MTVRLGYACINMTLQERKPNKVSCNRGMIKRTFAQKGLLYASELALKNTMDLIKIIAWNNEQGLEVFRMTSCMFPWMSEYELEELPDFEGIKANLEYAGKLARDAGQRLSFHPGHFNILTSPKERVVKNSIVDLKRHGQIMDLMGMARNHWSKINIHLGASYGDRPSAIDRWCKNFELLPESVTSRLTVENDDRGSLYSSKMLYDSVYKRLGVPIVFDSHHFSCGPEDSTYDEAIGMAVETWPRGITPQCHHSNSRKNYENSAVAKSAHSDWYYEPFKNCGHKVDIVLESKMKERALFKYKKDFLS
tara:strand:+ start:903 stop:1823 length:921 start_codon:yes stop_codon:yes gene_type:complete